MIPVANPRLRCYACSAMSETSDSAAAAAPAAAAATIAPLLPNFPITTHLPRHSLNIVCGPPNVGKSKLIQTAVRTYLDHGEWLGTFAPVFPDVGLPMVGRVGYLGAERLGLPDNVPQVAWEE